MHPAWKDSGLGNQVTGWVFPPEFYFQLQDSSETCAYLHVSGVVNDASKQYGYNSNILELCLTADWDAGVQ